MIPETLDHRKFSTGGRLRTLSSYFHRKRETMNISWTLVGRSVSIIIRNSSEEEVLAEELELNRASVNIDNRRLGDWHVIDTCCFIYSPPTGSSLGRDFHSESTDFKGESSEG